MSKWLALVVALGLLCGCPGFIELPPEEQLLFLQESELHPTVQYEILCTIHEGNCPPFEPNPDDGGWGGSASWTPIFFLLQDPEGDQVVVLLPIYVLMSGSPWTVVELHGSLPCNVDLIEVAEDIPAYEGAQT